MTYSLWNTFDRRFLLGIRFHIQKEDIAIDPWIWLPQWNCCRKKYILQKQKVIGYPFVSDSDFFIIVYGLLQGDKLTSYISINFLHYAFRTSVDIKENGFLLKKARSRQYSAEVLTDADYTDDLEHLANITS